MNNASFLNRRNQLERYFDDSAAETWLKLTSDAPVSGIRATVRAGRDRMRATLLGWLPADMTGMRLLDAGCGTGALAIEAARRGADVVAVDLAPTLLDGARERLPGDVGAGRIRFVAGDMLDPTHGRFDYIVAMDSLIHYQTHDVLRALGQLGARASRAVLFTFAPRTPLLAAMHTVGRLFPRADRAPQIVPVGEKQLKRSVQNDPILTPLTLGRDQRIVSGFYTSHALELVRP